MKTSDDEQAKGHLAFWLDPEDIEFIVNEWRKIPDDAPTEIRETWARIAFRASSALHKAGIGTTPKFPNEDEKYKI